MQSAGSGYSGVSIAVKGSTVYVYDGEGGEPPRVYNLAFEDLVGQPTWIQSDRIICPTVLRGDIDLGDNVTFPKGVMTPYALTQPSAAAPGAPAASNVTFQGTFNITEIHHYGNFRQADAASWNTTFMASAPVGGA